MARPRSAWLWSALAGPLRPAGEVGAAAAGGAAPKGLLNFLSAQYGWLSLAPTPFPLVPALQKALTVRGYWLAEITTNPERLARAKSYVYDRVQSGQLKPKIAKAFRFEDVGEAYRYMESNEQIGKIVLTIGN